MQKLNILDLQKVANASYYKKSQLVRMNKIDLTNLADEMLGYSFDDSTKQTLIDGLMAITNKDYKDLLVAHLDENSNDYDY